MKTYHVTITYRGEVEAESAEDIEAALWETCEIIGPPIHALLQAEEIDIELEDDEE
tara:strand:- start:97 stop:264 length:168 start_codon:yes stop_codon:yes gene_type:complete